MRQLGSSNVFCTSVFARTPRCWSPIEKAAARTNSPSPISFTGANNFKEGTSIVILKLIATASMLPWIYGASRPFTIRWRSSFLLKHCLRCVNDRPNNPLVAMPSAFRIHIHMAVARVPLRHVGLFVVLITLVLLFVVVASAVQLH